MVPLNRAGELASASCSSMPDSSSRRAAFSSAACACKAASMRRSSACCAAVSPSFGRLFADSVRVSIPAPSSVRGHLVDLQLLEDLDSAAVERAGRALRMS